MTVVKPNHYNLSVLADKNPDSHVSKNQSSPYYHQWGV